MKTDKDNETFRFDHPMDIVRGEGRIVFAREGTIANDRIFRPGWVLPGGERTDDQERAVAAAQAINSIALKARLG